MSWLHVLLVDDHASDEALIDGELQRNGFDAAIERVTDAVALQAAIDRQFWDAVIADYTLVHFSALEALDLLHRSGQDRPFIVISDTADEQHAVDAMRAGAHDYLMKDNLHRLTPAIEREIRDAGIRVAQRQAMAALHLRNRAIEASNNGIVISALDESDVPIIYVNPAFERLTGYSADEIIGRNGRFLEGPQTDPVAIDALQQALEKTETAQIEILNYRKDRSTFWNSLSLSPVFDPDQQRSYVIGILQDVTARRQAEDALRNSETRFATIFRSGSTAMCISIEATSAIIDANDSFLNMLGYARDEIIGFSVNDLDLWTDPTERQRMHQLFLRQGYVRDFEFTFRHKSGEVRNCLGSFEPLELDGVLCVLTSAYDITERKRLEALRAREEQFRLLFQHSPDAITLIDPHAPGRIWPIVDCNDVACIMNGYSREEMIGMPIGTLLEEQNDAVAREKYITWLRQIGAHIGEDVHRRKDGTLITIEYSNSLIIIGGRELILGIDREITERKRIEELHRSEQQFQVLFQQLPDSLVLIDPHHSSGIWTITDCNEAAYRMHGYSRKQLRGRAFDMLQEHQHTTDELAHILDGLRDSLSVTGQDIQRHRNGMTFPTEYTASLITIDGRELILRIDRDISERIKAEQAQQAITAYERFQAQVLEQINDAVIATDLQFRIRSWNHAAETIYGWRAEETLGRLVTEIIPTIRYLGGNQEDSLVLLSNIGRWHGEVIQQHRDGHELVIEGSVQVIRDVQDAPISVVAVNRDITARKQSEQSLRTSEEYLRALVENGIDLITVLNPDGTIRYLSPSQDRVFGHSPRERVGRHIADMTYPEDRHLALDLLAQVLDEPERTVTAEIRVLHHDGSYRILDVTAVNMLAHPSVQGIVINAHDITDRKRMEEQLVHDAFHDVLTGLPNRALFFDRMHKAQQRSWRAPGHQFAVLFLDLDRFKNINDTLGHSFGDQLLIEVGRRLESGLRLVDTVARLGGDEFAILIEDLADISFATQIASKLCRAIEVPFLIGGQEIVTSASVGIAFSTSNNQRLDELLRDADIAMYRAKRLGNGRHMLADPTLHSAIRERLQLEADLRQALERGELSLDYQPKVAIDGRTIIGVEALCRWDHPERGMIPPVEFIPVAEESGLIISLGEWVLRTACSQIKRWHEEGVPQIFVAVNISALQFRRSNLAQTISTILREVGLEPRYLALELTESILMDDAESASTVLRELLATGIGHVAMDDFGTGYSSLSYLQRFPISAIKIDRTFVNEVATSSGGSAIAAAIIALAHSLGLTTIAEGVETEQQRSWLEQHGCDMFQGYLFSRPLPVDQISKVLSASHSATPDLVGGTSLI